MISVSDLVRSLRKALGETQQQFANRCGLAIITIARYEAERSPELRELNKFYRLAIEIGNVELEKRFHVAIEDKLTKLLGCHKVELLIHL